jgi:hypothetical protein
MKAIEAVRARIAYGYEQVSSSTQISGHSGTHEVSCDAGEGKSVLGGGIEILPNGTDTNFATDSRPLDLETVSAEAIGPVKGDWTLTAWATCATASN